MIMQAFFKIAYVILWHPATSAGFVLSKVRCLLLSEMWALTLAK